MTVIPWKSGVLLLSITGDTAAHLITPHRFWGLSYTWQSDPEWKPGCQTMFRFTPAGFISQVSLELPYHTEARVETCCCYWIMFSHFAERDLTWVRSHSWIPDSDDVMHRDSEEAALFLLKMLSAPSKSNKFCTVSPHQPPACPPRTIRYCWEWQ